LQKMKSSTFQAGSERSSAQIVKPTLARKLKNQKPASAKEWGTHFLGEEDETLGHLYFRKVAQNLDQSAFLSAREIEHGRFRALFAGWFCSKMQSALSTQHSALSQNQHQKRFTTEDTSPGRKAEPYARVPARAVSTPDDWPKCAAPRK
jgi:hypothetical protein